MYARMTNVRFPPEMRAEVVAVARGLVPVLKQQRGYRRLDVLTDPGAGVGIIVSFWETQADAEATETNASYIGQMSMMSSYLYEALAPKTYEVDVQD